jgi:hypothetical protein
MNKLTVTAIVMNHDRKLLYGHPKWPNYHLIANLNDNVNVGDTVEYKPQGINFGWFKKVINPNNTNEKDRLLSIREFCIDLLWNAERHFSNTSTPDAIRLILEEIDRTETER